MTDAMANVGRFDALARRVAGCFALLGGIVSIDGFFRSFPLLTWVVLAIMADTGLFFGIPGLRGGTVFSGVLLAVLAVADGWLAVLHLGHWALLIGIVIAADEFLTAGRHWSLLNRLLHRDTRQADQEWLGPPLHHAP